MTKKLFALFFVMFPTNFVHDLVLVKPMEEMIMGSNNYNTNNNINPKPTNQLQVNNNMERRLVRPQKEQSLNCPRCNSTNTKFCYYNNYSLTQPRYFCKTCRRYWTEGGSLRNVPVGGGSRKNRKPSSSSASSTSSLPTIEASNTSSKKMATEVDPNISSTQNPKFQEGQDLNLAFPPLPEFGACTSTSTRSNTSAMGLNMNPFVPLMHPMAPIVPEYPSEYYRSNTLSFPLDVGVGGGASGSYESTGGRLLFPFEEAREVNKSNSNANASEGADQFEQDVKVGPPPGFWNGMINGGGGSPSW